jgi:hypothetical protein
MPASQQLPARIACRWRPRTELMALGCGNYPELVLPYFIPQRQYLASWFVRMALWSCMWSVEDWVARCNPVGMLDAIALCSHPWGTWIVCSPFLAYR